MKDVLNKAMRQKEERIEHSNKYLEVKQKRITNSYEIE